MDASIQAARVHGHEIVKLTVANVDHAGIGLYE